MKKLTNNNKHYTPKPWHGQGHWNKREIDRKRAHGIWYLYTQQGLTLQNLATAFHLSRQRIKQIVVEYQDFINHLELTKGGEQHGQ
jgi:hypothetical protein